MFKWLVLIGVFAALFVQNRLLKHHVQLLEVSQQRYIETEWQQQTHEHLALLEDLGEYFNGRPNRWPVLGEISSWFGFRMDPFHGTQAMHDGIDIVAPDGTPIHAPAPGRVIFVGDGGAFGNLIVIEHKNKLLTRYGHLSDYFVHVGEWVKRGEKIAEVGSTGRSTASHLHYAVEKNGIYQDPTEYLE